MKCIRCNRPIRQPAATVGIYAYGPKCARAAGQALIKAASSRAQVAQVADTRQVDWVREEPVATGFHASVSSPVSILETGNHEE